MRSFELALIQQNQLGTSRVEVVQRYLQGKKRTWGTGSGHRWFMICFFCCKLSVEGEIHCVD